jgi:exopolysaccharide biosynthesis polyprenyl glycosylphosphotransferase
VLGFLDERAPVGGAVLGRIADLARIVRRDFVDEIILTTTTYGEVTRRVIREAQANQIDVRLVPDFFGCDPAPVVLRKYGNVPVLTLSEERVPIFRLLVKRGLDVVLSAVGLLFALPLLAAIGCAIHLDSPGPTLYCAPRLGLKGRRFLCFKFRTMIANADGLKQKLRACNQRSGAFFKIVDDPRVTHLGRILRRYSLDELPQLWNVLRGEMSLVGPRPHPVDDFERYDLQDLQRLEVLPGLTGLWQVTARNDPSFERSMALDREYIGRWTLGLDLRILFKTVAVVWRGEGA